MNASNEGLLFDISPEERDGQAKKKGGRKKKLPEALPSRANAATADLPPPRGYLAAIDGHHQCDQCGLTLLDLVEIRRVDGREQWLISCGWLCMHSWLVDPIPGVIEAQDAKDVQQESFRVRGGRFDGKTLDEIDAAGGRWYIEQLVKSGKRTFLAEAAAKWLTESEVRIR